MTLLAPTIVEAIVEGQQSWVVTLEALREHFPVDWRQQEPWFEKRARSGLRRDPSGL